MKITFESKPSSKNDTAVVFAYDHTKLTDAARDLDKKVNGSIKKLLKIDDFKGKAGELAILSPATGSGYDRIIVVGLGKTAEYSAASTTKTGGKLFDELNKKSQSAQIFCDFADKPFTNDFYAAHFAAGALLNSYRFNKYFTKKDKKGEVKLTSLKLVAGKNADKAKKLFTRLNAPIKGTFWARDLVTETPNVLYPETYANIIKKELQPHGIKVTILGRSQLKKLGMGAMLSVGQGAEHEEKLVVMEYKGTKASKRNVAFVGKGITFDSGGISLKPGAGMWDMKYDMGGSAAVVGLMKSLALRKAKANIIGIVALAENMPSGNATRPSDVVTTMSGQTVEILNTDAEGRLVLCDAMWYVQEKYKPTHMIDLATLTGAILMALGYEYGGAFSNDEKLVKHLIEAGSHVEEKLWHMPMHDNWDKEMNSDIADIRNISTAGKAGSATAACYLKRFVQSGVKWAHLDIAGMAWAYSKQDITPKGASGFGVRLLDKYVEDHCEK